MKVYRYWFDGEALGGTIVVVAKNETKAFELAEKSLKGRYPREKHPAKNHELELFDEYDFDPNGCEVYFWDGEY